MEALLQKTRRLEELTSSDHPFHRSELVHHLLDESLRERKGLERNRRRTIRVCATTHLNSINTRWPGRFQGAFPLELVD